MTGVTIRTWSSELTIPPSTGVASGFMTSAPARVDHIIGSRLATVVATVINLGRSRSSAPAVTASIRSCARHCPSRRRALEAAASRPPPRGRSP
jgi:hypothetical protein